MQVVQLGDAAEALERAGGSLAEAGAEGELSYGILDRLTREPDAWGEVVLLLGRLDGEPAALVSITGEHPALICGFTDPGLIGYRDLVTAMLRAGRRPQLVNGSCRFNDPYARAWQEIAGVTATVDREMRAFELRQVRGPVQPEGRFRVATSGDMELLAAWAVVMGDDIREPTTPDQAEPMIDRLIGLGDLAVWDCDGDPVSMAAVPRRTPSSSSISLGLHTAADARARLRQRAVAALSQRELDAGMSWCSLFTDLANPTSNHIVRRDRLPAGGRLPRLRAQLVMPEVGERRRRAQVGGVAAEAGDEAQRRAHRRPPVAEPHPRRLSDASGCDSRAIARQLPETRRCSTKVTSSPAWPGWNRTDQTTQPLPAAGQESW